MKANLTSDSAHCSFHKVARESSHVCSKAVANQVNIPKRKLFLFLHKVTKEHELKSVVLGLWGYQQLNKSIVMEEGSQGSQPKDTLQHYQCCWHAIWMVHQGQGVLKDLVWHLKCQGDGVEDMTPDGRPELCKLSYEVSFLWGHRCISVKVKDTIPTANQSASHDCSDR